MSISAGPKPWHKTTKGIILLSLLAIILPVVLFFVSLFGYYTWQLVFGDADSLDAQFANDFSTTEELSSQRVGASVTEDARQYIRGHSPTLGEPDAPVTIIAFIDFECPYCRAAFPVFQQVVDTYGPAIRVVFKHFPLTSIHPLAVQAGLAAACAHDQNTFWPFYASLFENRALDESSLSTYAERLGLDMPTFRQCIKSNVHQNELDQDFRDGVALGVRGTPTYIVNDTKVEGALSKEQWESILLSEIQ